MNLTFAQLPEMRQLSSTERKQVYSQCIHPILMRWPSRFIKFGFTIVLFFGALRLDLWDSGIRCTFFMVAYLMAGHL